MTHLTNKELDKINNLESGIIGNIARMCVTEDYRENCRECGSIILKGTVNSEHKRKKVFRYASHSHSAIQTVRKENKNGI